MHYLYQHHQGTQDEPLHHHLMMRVVVEYDLQIIYSDSGVDPKLQISDLMVLMDHYSLKN